MIFETRLSTLNISHAKRAPNTINFVDMRIGCPCSKALSKDGCEVEGCESWENIYKLKGENKPSPY